MRPSCLYNGHPYVTSLYWDGSHLLCCGLVYLINVPCRNDYKSFLAGSCFHCKCFYLSCSERANSWHKHSTSQIYSWFSPWRCDCHVTRFCCQLIAKPGNKTASPSWPGPVFCLVLAVSSDYAQPITGPVTEVTCPVISRAQLELTLSKRQETGPDLYSSCSRLAFCFGLLVFKLYSSELRDWHWNSHWVATMVMKQP